MTYSQVYLKEKPFENFTGGESYVFDKTMEVCLHSQTREVLVDPATKVRVHISWIWCINNNVNIKFMKFPDAPLLNGEPKNLKYRDLICRPKWRYSRSRLILCGSLNKMLWFVLHLIHNCCTNIWNNFVENYTATGFE